MQRSLVTFLQSKHLTASVRCRLPGRSIGISGSRMTMEGGIASQEAWIEAFEETQGRAPRVSLAIQARTLVANATWGVLGTVSSAQSCAGFPSGSVVEYAVGEATPLPIFALSTLSPHTRDVQQDDRVSLTIPAPNSQGLADARVTLIGRLRRLDVPEEARALQEIYAQRHPSSYWVSFDDFSMHAMHDLQSVRIVGGFARAGTVLPADYLAALPDPIAPFTEPIAKHMNEDRAQELIAMVRHYCQFSATQACIVGVDALGMDVRASKEGNEEIVSLRLAFLEPATDRRSVRERVIQMVHDIPPS